MESLETRTLPRSLEDRVLTTLRIADRWGYGLAGEDVARLLYGGSANASDVTSALAYSLGIVYRDGVATLPGRDDLVEKSLARRRSNGELAALYFGIAEEFSRDLLRHSPFVRSVAVCGSTASGGIEAGDDIDFNLFAEDGTKYIVYLTALLLGVKYSLLHGRRFRRGTSFLGLLPKVTCVNVVWTESDARPFVRQDESLAFELLRSVPIAGTAHHTRTLEANAWLGIHFPQIFTRVFADRVGAQPPSLVARVLRGIARSPRGRRLLDGACRGIAVAIHRVVRLSRELDPEAMARLAFLRRVKFPYDVFQD
jgi:hypothetical protein